MICEQSEDIIIQNHKIILLIWPLEPQTQPQGQSKTKTNPSHIIIHIHTYIREHNYVAMTIHKKLKHAIHWRAFYFIITIVLDYVLIDSLE